MNYDPAAPAFQSLRVTQQENEIADLQAQFPKLSRTEIIDIISAAGPMRMTVEAELARVSARKR